MDIADEAYDSLPSGTSRSEFKEDGKQREMGAGSEGQGSSPTAGTPPKERSAMNIGDKLFSGERRSVDNPLSSADTGGPIKQTASTSSNPKSLTMSNAMTPTTFLAGQLGSISFRGSMEGKFSSLADSPTSDYASGNFSSLAESDRGYASMPSMTSLEKPDNSMTQSNPAIEKPILITGDGSMGEKMDVDKASVKSSSMTTAVPSKIDIQDTALFAGKVPSRTSSETSSFSEASSLMSMLAPSPLVRSESPASVPAIAEDIEVATESVPSPSSSRLEGVASKRSATGLLERDLGPSTKNPRLSPEASLSKFSNSQQLSGVRGGKGRGRKGKGRPREEGKGGSNKACPLFGCGFWLVVSSSG